MSKDYHILSFTCCSTWLSLKKQIPHIVFSLLPCLTFCCFVFSCFQAEKGVSAKKFPDLVSLVNEYLNRGSRNGLVHALKYPVEVQESPDTDSGRLFDTGINRLPQMLKCGLHQQICVNKSCLL